MAHPPAIPLPRHLRANRNPHPGAVDAVRPRRSTQEVQEERKLKAQDAAEREQNREQTILKTAELEKELRAIHEEKLRTASNPPLAAIKKVLRPRPAAPVKNTGPKDLENIPVDGVSSDSEEEYMPVVADGKGEADTSGSSDEDEGMDVESEDSDGGHKQPKKKRPVKGALRTAIDAALHVPLEESTSNATGKKRKAKSQLKPPGRSLDKKLVAKSGLRDNWQDPSDEYRDGSLASDDGFPSSLPASSIYRGSSEPSSAYDPISTTTEGFGDDDVGGISDDEGENAERNGMPKEGTLGRYREAVDMDGSNERKIRSLARIVPTTTVSTFINPTTSAKIARTHLKKDSIRLHHLPSHLQTSFDRIFLPRAREVFGYTTPWGNLDIESLEMAWATCFPGEVFDNVALKLVEDRLHAWRNKFANAALSFLDKVLFRQLPDNCAQSRAELCTWMLSGPEHMHPYYFRIYDEPAEDDGEGKVKASGIFQSLAVSTVLATHYSSILSIPMSERSEKRPTGALVLTLQAIKRALRMWTTGEKVELQRPFNDFSKTNWGDTSVIHEGKAVPTRTTTNLIHVLDKLKTKQWDKIIEAAIDASKNGSRRSLVVGEKQEQDDITKPSFELVDDDSDLNE